MFDKTFELYGFIQGDGDLGRLKSHSHNGLEINIGKKDLDICDYLDIEKPKDRTIYYNINNITKTLSQMGFSSEALPNRNLLKTFNDWNDLQKVSFFRGLYSANGCFIKAGRIAFKTTCKGLSLEIKEYLESLGLHPYITTNKPKVVEFPNGEYLCKESYDINIGRQTEVKWFYCNIGFIQKYKMDDIRDYLYKKGILYENS
jgi:hypothetical protein